MLGVVLLSLGRFVTFGYVGTFWTGAGDRLAGVSTSCTQTCYGMQQLCTSTEVATQQLALRITRARLELFPIRVRGKHIEPLHIEAYGLRTGIVVEYIVICKGMLGNARQLSLIGFRLHHSCKPTKKAPSSVGRVRGLLLYTCQHPMKSMFQGTLRFK